MKTLYIPTAILALILGFSLWGGMYSDMRTDQWITLLDEAGALAQQENWDEANRVLDEAYRDWNSSQTFYHTTMKHEDLDEAEFFFTGAIAACREEDNEEFHILLAQLIKQLQLLAEAQKVSLQNIL